MTKYAIISPCTPANSPAISDHDLVRKITHEPLREYVRNETRRQFFSRGSNAVGWAALAALLGGEGAGRLLAGDNARTTPACTHFAPKAKQVIYLHMVGGPPQMDLYDYKPEMNEWYDKDLPDSVRMGQRLTTMTSGQKRFPIAPSKYKFAQHGQVRHVGHASCCRTRPGWSTTCASSAACTPRPSTTSRPSPTCRRATRSPAGLAWAPGLRTASVR